MFRSREVREILLKKIFGRKLFRRLIQFSGLAIPNSFIWNFEIQIWTFHVKILNSKMFFFVIVRKKNRTEKFVEKKPMVLCYPVVMYFFWIFIFDFSSKFFIFNYDRIAKNNRQDFPESRIATQKIEFEIRGKKVNREWKVSVVLANKSFCHFKNCRFLHRFTETASIDKHFYSILNLRFSNMFCITK